MNPLRFPQKLLEDWAVSSQLNARRNAMLASTALAQHRAEILDVEEFFAARRPHDHPHDRAAAHG